MPFERKDTRNYYEILEVERDSSLSQITKNYRRLALQWHPDKNLSDKKEAEEIFKKISRAYQVLSSHEKRVLYDLNNPDEESEDDLNNHYEEFSPEWFDRQIEIIRILRKETERDLERGRLLEKKIKRELIIQKINLLLIQLRLDPEKHFDKPYPWLPCETWEEKAEAITELDELKNFYELMTGEAMQKALRNKWAKDNRRWEYDMITQEIKQLIFLLELDPEKHFDKPYPWLPCETWEEKAEAITELDELKNFYELMKEATWKAFENKDLFENVFLEDVTRNNPFVQKSSFVSTVSQNCSQVNAECYELPEWNVVEIKIKQMFSWKSKFSLIKIKNGAKERALDAPFFFSHVGIYEETRHEVKDKIIRNADKWEIDKRIIRKRLNPRDNEESELLFHNSFRFEYNEKDGELLIEPGKVHWIFGFSEKEQQEIRSVIRKKKTNFQKQQDQAQQKQQDQAQQKQQDQAQQKQQDQAQQKQQDQAQIQAPLH